MPICEAQPVVDQPTIAASKYFLKTFILHMYLSKTKQVDKNLRVDPALGTVVHVVGNRQSRPNLATNTSTSECPFCIGGLEAPEPYDVRSFVNRWPPMPDDRCEVILYTSDHNASFGSLSIEQAKKVIDLWAERTSQLAARADVDYVLVFENRGAEVGATISHPHGQIYAYDHVPERPHQLFTNNWTPDETAERVINSNSEWTSFVPFASIYPTAVTVAPRQRVSDLNSLSTKQRLELAEMLIETITRLDQLFETPLPYMMWINQQPANGLEKDAWMSVEIVSPWRQKGLARFIAAAEVGAGEYFNPVVPEQLAEKLRAISL
jgi:UDPglucose--hexose-1-phosphate uridylyltransferase